MSELRNGRSDFERQMLLVTAALHEDERGLDAWRTWSAGAEVEYLTPGEIRLLGIGWRGLRRLGADGPMFKVAGGVYRRTWYVISSPSGGRQIIGISMKPRGPRSRSRGSRSRS